MMEEKFIELVFAQHSPEFTEGKQRNEGTEHNEAAGG